MSLQKSVVGDRDSSRFLRHDDGQRIGLLRDAQSSTVAHAIGLRNILAGDRQHTLSSNNPVATDDHTAIVQRRILEEDVLDNASYFGIIFARSGGLSDAVAQGLKEQNIDFELKAVTCDGIEECRTALLKKSKNVLDGKFIEGMA